MFDGALVQFYVFQTDEATCGYLIKCHHIVADGWSMKIIIDKIKDLYMLLAKGELPEEAADDYSILIEKEKNTFLRHDIKKMPHFGKKNFLICRTASCQKVQRTLLVNANDLN
ncbi:condensation domain-containing protein [Bacillus stercoris]|nr:condensation domain-containing protein [Bacillus stercoris]